MNPMTPVTAQRAISCFLCAAAVAVWPVVGDHADVDCPRCGRIRVPGRTSARFSAEMMAQFDRAWLSAKVQQMTDIDWVSRRKIISVEVLSGWRLLALIMRRRHLDEDAARMLIRPYFERGLEPHEILELLSVRPPCSAAG